MEQRILPQEESYTPPDALTPTLGETSTDSTLNSERSVSPSKSEQVQVLEVKIKRLVKQHFRRMDFIVWATTWGTAASIFYGLGSIMRLLPLPFHLIFLTIVSSVVGVGFQWRTKLRRQNRQISQELMDLKELQAIDALIDTLKLDDGENHRLSIEALITLLPEVPLGGTDLLNANQCAFLCSRLNKPLQLSMAEFNRPLSPEEYRRAVAFRIATLQALTQAGDSRAMTTVSRLAQEEATTADEQKIQDAARICLSALAQRAEKLYSSQTLLRPSQSSDSGADTLLRAAAGGQATPSYQLLRSSQQQEET